MYKNRIFGKSSNNKYMKEGKIMQNLNQAELQHLRHLIGSQDTSYQKLQNYAEYAVDPQIKQVFNKAAQDCLNTKQKLLSFLEN